MRVLTFLALFVVLAAPAFAQPPAQAPPPPCNPAGDGKVRFICGQQAPEDLVVVPGGDWVLASAFAGAGGIRLINAKDQTSINAYPTPTSKDRLDAKTYDSCPGAPDAAEKAK